jgi:hypothetical protein
MQDAERNPIHRLNLNVVQFVNKFQLSASTSLPLTSGQSPT